MANFIEKLTGKVKPGENGEDKPAYTLSSDKGEIEIGNMNQLGYIGAGRHNGDPAALFNSFQLIKSGQIVDEGNNELKKKEATDALDSQINDLKEKISGHKTAMDKIDQVDLPAIESEVEKNKLKIEQIRAEARNNRYQRNRFNLIILWTGFILGLFYLYLFYVSAIHSALFRNIAAEVAKATTDNVGLLLNNVFNLTAFKEFNIHWFAPVVFFIFAFIFHFTLEIKTRSVRYISITVVVLFVLAADGMLAYFIEKNNHLLGRLMGLSDDSWAFYKSSGFYLVLFFGFFTSMGWSIILHKLAKEFETGNPERKAEAEISSLEKVLRQLNYEKGVAATSRIENINAIASIEERIKALERSKTNVHYSLIDLENNIDNFYNGWLSYLNGLKSGVAIKQECEKVYSGFKTENINKSLTA